MPEETDEQKCLQEVGEILKKYGMTITVQPPQAILVKVPKEETKVVKPV